MLTKGHGGFWSGRVPAGWLGPTDRRTQPAQLAFHGFPEILKQMKTIGDLPRLGRSLPRSVSIEAGAVTADDFDFGVALQPCRGGSGRAIREQVNHAPRLEIDDHGPVCHALLPGPVINSGHTNGHPPILGLRASLYTPQDRRVAYRHTKPRQQAFGRAPARAVPEEPDNFGHADGAARERGRQIRNTAGENTAFAMLVSAAPAVHPRSDCDGRPLRRDILKRSDVGTVPRARSRATGWAGCTIPAVHGNGPPGLSLLAP